MQLSHVVSRTIGLASLFTCCNTPAPAATINVPASQPTIQAAINAAVNGDQVVIAPGTYHEMINFNGKAINVKGDLLNPSATVIEGTGLNGALVTFNSGETSDSKLLGLTVRLGSPGVQISNSSSPYISTCNFEQNDDTNGGGLIVSSGNPFVIDCEFTDNTATTGGGIHVSGGTPSIERCKFTGNHATGGGGINVSDGSAYIWDCRIIDNDATAGGGIEVSYHASATILGCRFKGNSAAGGAALACSSTGTTVLASAEVFDNDGLYTTITASGRCTLQIVNCTIVNNVGTAIHISTLPSTPTVSIANSIIRGNTTQIFPANAGVTVSYSDIEGGWSGRGNFDALPWFVSIAQNDFHLMSVSPCVDAGSNPLVPATAHLDFDGNYRFLNDPEVLNTGVGTSPIVDIGAHERLDGVIYVKGNATGLNTGVNWTDAFTNLQDALDQAAITGQTSIFVAAGTYFPDRGTANRALSFEMRSGLQVVGGFAGTETEINQGNPLVNSTILSGAIGAAGTADNSYHVVRATNIDSTGKLLGCIVQRGNANSAVTPDNRGGGIYIDGGAPVIRECNLRNNNATSLGGGLYTLNSSANISRNQFNQNTCSNDGGGIAALGGAPQIMNCLMSGNSTTDQGGALYVASNAACELLNCTIIGNSSTGGENGGALVLSGSITARNNILWGNTGTVGTTQNKQFRVLAPGTGTINHSCVEGWTGSLGGTFNFGNTPKMIDPDGADNIFGTSDDNARLSAESPCIDSADAASLPSYANNDIEGNSRYLDDPGMPNSGSGTTVYLDRGCYEFQNHSCLADISPRPSGNGFVNTDDLLAIINNWGVCAGCAADVAPAPVGNGSINVDDLLFIINSWGACP